MHFDRKLDGRFVIAELQSLAQRKSVGKEIPKSEIVWTILTTFALQMALLNVTSCCDRMTCLEDLIYIQNKLK